MSVIAEQELEEIARAKVITSIHGCGLSGKDGQWLISVIDRLLAAEKRLQTDLNQYALTAQKPRESLS